MNRSGRVSAHTYGVSLACLVVALLVRWLLDPVWGDTLAFTTFFAAIGVAVWLGGYRLALLVVANNGIGFPPAMLHRVFEMFTQVDRALKKAAGGLGIGLSLVKGLVGRHGGTIEAHREGEGLGGGP